tara:strand:- start:22304 stop:22834 length:531 start_codon:yes stop_codon:yes gene_type:complete
MLEIINIIVFFIFYKLDGIYTATISVIIGQSIIYAIKYKKKTYNNMDTFSLLAVLLFGAITLLLHDPYYIKIKPSIIYCLTAGVFIISEILNKSLLLKGFKAMQNQTSGIIINEKRTKISAYLFSLFFLIMAGLNYYFAIYFSEDFWVNFKLLSIIPFFIMSILLFFFCLTFKKES